MAKDNAAKPAADAGPPVADLTYSEASRELDQIVAFFEGREVDVDQLVARLERATALVDELDRRLRRTRTQVEELVPRLAAAGAGSDAEPEDEDGLEEAELEEAELEEADELVEEIDQAMEDRAPSDAPGLF